MELEKWRDRGLESHINIVDFLSLLLDSTYSLEAVDLNSFNSLPASANNLSDANNNGSNESLDSEEAKMMVTSQPYLLTNLNGNKTAWLLNNNMYTNPLNTKTIITLNDLLASEIKAASLVTNRGMVNRLIVGTIGELPDQIIMVYERPNAYLYRSNKKVTKRKVWGYTPKKSFYSPNYYQMMMPKEPDNRRTLYWAPNVFVDDLGKATAVFFNNSHDGTQLRISIQGITLDGRMVSFER